MLTTLRHFLSFNNVVTVQYPEQKVELPPWTRGRPRLIYEVDTGDLRCTACGACALACPVDVIKIEQHPSPVKGKVLDRFDLDMGGCIECALCVEACPFRAIVMAPDFEFGTYNRERDLVFNMHELRIAGTPEVDAAMEFIQGVKRGLAGQQGGAGGAPAAVGAKPAPAAKPAAAGAKPAAAAKPSAAGAKPPPAAAAAADANGSAAPGPAAASPPPSKQPVAAAAGAAQPAAASSGGGGPLDRTPDMEGLSATDRAKIYKERAAAAGIGGTPNPEGQG